MYVPALPSPAVATGASAPTYDPIQLVECTRIVAARVLAGDYPFISFAAERWHRRIHQDRSVDIWLISWLPSQGTELHDHGGSAGAFTVVRGELAEACYVGDGSLRERRHPAGGSIGFSSQHIHDVRNLSDAPAVSVHAYSRPLALMNYYELSTPGRLRTVDSIRTTDPEEGRWAS